MKVSKAFSAVITIVSTTSALIFLGLLSSQAEPFKPGMLIGQEVNSEPSALPSPSVAPDRLENPQPSLEPSVEPSVPPDTLDNMGFESLDAKVLEIGKQFGKLDQNTKLASFDAKAAKEAGYESEIIQLVKEQVEFQNELVESLKTKKTRMGEFKPSAKKYPKLKKFKDRATAEAKKPKAKTSLSKPIKIAGSLVDGYLIAENTATACGTYAFPKPNVTPTRYYYTQTNPPARDWLLTNGFHKTGDYATGNYRNNYTRSTFYRGVEGTCDSPKFRDDGTVTTTYNMNIQYKEPNPEVLDYGNWPYLGWGEYVNWWHANY